MDIYTELKYALEHPEDISGWWDSNGDDDVVTIKVSGRLAKRLMAVAQMDELDENVKPRRGGMMLSWNLAVAKGMLTMAGLFDGEYTNFLADGPGMVQLREGVLAQIERLYDRGDGPLTKAEFYKAMSWVLNTVPYSANVAEGWAIAVIEPL